MIITRALAILAAAVCAFAQAGAPSFRSEDVRPHGSAEPHPLNPSMLTWIFGTDLATPPGCSARNLMDPTTYPTELCGTRVLLGGMEAKLIAVMPGQINLVLPDHGWENEKVDVQVVHDGRASALVPVYFGFRRPVISLAEPAFAGMPVWLRVEKPWGKGRLRYPFYTEPWDLGGGSFEVRLQGRELPFLKLLPYPPPEYQGMTMGLPHDVAPRLLERVPLHLAFPVDQPGSYQIRYTEYRSGPGDGNKAVHLQSDWTTVQILPSTAEQRRAWFHSLTAAPPEDTVELLSNFLPSLLAARDEAALRVLARYLDSSDSLVRQYAAYGLNYFDAGLLQRVVPGRQPLRGGVRG